MWQVPGRDPYLVPSSHSFFQVSEEDMGTIGIFSSIAIRNGPFLKGCNWGGYSSAIPPSGKIINVVPFFNRSDASLKARYDDILLSRLTGISTERKNNPVTKPSFKA